ncbi:hypothetical protein B7494_g5938 [Chlorociboria aeruginascens]|nr:hypothetical protein B7494_g5938 [Chlorociboria aeruginascens]
MTEAGKHIVILGGGVTGLQTVISLLTSPSSPASSQIPPSKPYRITLIAAHLPGDYSLDYTSPWAGGLWRSHATLSSRQEIRDWDARTYQYWMSLLSPPSSLSSSVATADQERQKRAKEIGLGIKESRNYWGSHSEETRADGDGLWWKNCVRGFEVLDLEGERTGNENREGGEKTPAGAVFGIKYVSICINVPVYLNYLYTRAVDLGARVVKAKVETSEGLEGVVKNVKSMLKEKEEEEEEEIFALINCAGLSSRHFLPPLESAKLHPIRGQTILVAGEASKARTYTNFLPDASAVAYVIPRPGSGTTILGGCKQAGNWEAAVDEELSGEILARVRSEGMAGELLRKGEFEVLGTQVGFRPGREGGPRVEVEKENEGKVEGVWVLHSYGHAGAGYQNSVGCAEKVVHLIEGLS